MQIQLHGGTRSEREIISTARGGILDGFFHAALGLGDIYKREPTEVLVTTLAADIMSEYMALAANKKLNNESALLEMVIKGGEIAYRDIKGKVILRYTILGIQGEPKKHHKKEYSNWKQRFYDTIKLIKDNHPEKFDAVSYSVMESIVIFVFKN